MIIVLQQTSIRVKFVFSVTYWIKNCLFKSLSCNPKLMIRKILLTTVGRTANSNNFLSPLAVQYVPFLFCWFWTSTTLLASLLSACGGGKNLRTVPEDCTSAVPDWNPIVGEGPNNMLSDRAKTKTKWTSQVWQTWFHNMSAVAWPFWSLAYAFDPGPLWHALWKILWWNWHHKQLVLTCWWGLISWTILPYFELTLSTKQPQHHSQHGPKLPSLSNNCGGRNDSWTRCNNESLRSLKQFDSFDVSFHLKSAGFRWRPLLQAGGHIHELLHQVCQIFLGQRFLAANGPRLMTETLEL